MSHQTPRVDLDTHPHTHDNIERARSTRTVEVVYSVNTHNEDIPFTLMQHTSANKPYDDVSGTYTQIDGCHCLTPPSTHVPLRTLYRVLI